MALSKLHDHEWDGYQSYTEPLVQLAMELKPKKILDIGIGHWAFSTTIWLEVTTANVTTIDKGDWNNFGAHFTRQYSDRYKFIKGRTETEMPKLRGKYDLIYIDGDHYYEGCKADILNAQKLLAPGGIIVMDDYGVEIVSAVDLDDNGNVILDHFGVKQACDECFDDKWEQVLKHINFANGGRAYALKSGKRG